MIQSLLRTNLILLKCLTLKRLINLLKVRFYYYFSFGKPIKTHPSTLSFEPTTSCNLSCPECHSGRGEFTRPTGNAAFSLFKKIIDEESPYLLWLTLYFQGEPLLHPQFNEMVTYAKKRGIIVSTSTNGHFLSEKQCTALLQSGIDKIIISIDGIGQELYEKYRRGGSYNTVIQGLKQLKATQKELGIRHTEVVIQFLVFRSNEHQIPAIKQLAKALQVKLELKSAQFIDFHDGHPEIPTIARWSRYKQQKDGKWEIKNPLKNRCWRACSGAVITWDGKVLPCCFDKDADHVFGNASQQNTATIWSNKARHSFLQQLSKERKSVAICRNCTEGLRH